MKESADYLFHFTERYISIVDIMKNRFKPFFCVEDFSFMYNDRRNLIIAYPIVCFCDIPIERHNQHKENYGKYGIGLTKEWGIRNNLNIVNSSFASKI
ncbi:MAG: abortive infection system antitoxin AbiGi family protein [Bacteroidia bacterium]|nr:abortive infection system antitoxin AbiGi family protein [Bacteroidia bacterium]